MTPTACQQFAIAAVERAKLAANARRRGNIGWHVGRRIQVMPHVRAACPAANYWTGEGRKIPTVGFRRGAVIRRKKFSSVPTGFMVADKP
jgi:hypothetical protein